MQAIGFGTAPLAFREISLQQGVSTVHAALDCGIRLIDTALAYTREGIESYAEDLVRRALAQRADRIGLYQLHHVDPSVPLAESVGALRQLRDAGKIAEIGLSNVTIAQIEQARAEAPIATVQNRLSMADRGDLPTVEYCAREGLRYLAYMPLNGGKASRDDPAVAHLADRLGVSVAQIWLAWVLAQGSHVTALVGASRPATIRESARAVNVRLDHADLAALLIPGG